MGKEAGAGGAPATKRKRTKGGRYSHEITKEEIEQYYHLPCEEASRQLGIGLTILKRICRRLGIEKWPYRFLKRQIKADEAAATEGGGGSASPAALPSPFDAGAAGLPIVDVAPVSGAHSSGTSGDSGGSAPHSLGADQRSLEPPAPGLPPKQPGAAPPRRRAGPVGSSVAAAQRRSLDGGGRSASAAAVQRRSLELAAAARLAAQGTPSPDTSSGGLQRAASGGLKRIREDDILLGLLAAEADAAAPDVAPNPFAVAAASLPGDGGWPGADGGAAAPGEDDQLAAGMSKLRMRTLSLKRQCSRDDTALDALDQALLMERLAAQVAPSRAAMAAAGLGLGRAVSMPTPAGQRGSPPIPQWQPGGVPLYAPPPGALQEAGWLAQQTMHVPLPHGAPPAAPAASDADADLLHDPLAADLQLMSDPSLSGMLHFGNGRGGSGSDLASDQCLLPDLPPAGSSGLLAPGGSSCVLLECGGSGLLRNSSSGSARLGHGGSDALAGPPPSADAWPGAAAPAAGVTSVAGRAALPQADSAGDLASPFGGSTPFGGVDDLLADFLGGPSPRATDDAQLAELLKPLSPGPSPCSGHDDVLAGLLPPAGPPPAPALAPAAGPAESPRGAGSGSVVSHDTPTSSAGMPAAGAPPVGMALGGGPASAAPTPSPGEAAPLASRLPPVHDTARQALADQLLAKMQARQAALSAQQAALGAQQAALAQQQQAHQQQQAAAAALAGWPPQAAALDLGPPPVSPQMAELQAAAARHAEVQRAYLQQRDDVRAMFLHRQGGEGDRLRQLARLKALKLQLAAAQQRQNELRLAREARLAGRHPGAAPGMPPFPPPFPQQQQQQQAQQQHGGGLSVFGGSADAALGPPPPLPLTVDVLGSSTLRGPAEQPGMEGVAALYHQWATEDVAASASASASAAAPPGGAMQFGGRWPMLQPAWGAAMQPQLAPAVQPGALALHRAASAPTAAWDVDWQALL